MHKLKINGIPLPDLYVCDSESDAKICKENHLPYIIWKESDQDLIQRVMARALKKLFPNLTIPNSNKQLIVTVPGGDANNNQQPKNSGMVNDAIADIATEERVFKGENTNSTFCDIDRYVGDLTQYVDIEQLQYLKLLPKWLDDLATCIRSNMEGRHFWDGYNKKRGCCLGDWKPGSGELPNLIIIDVSWSIPQGIAATMLSLAATMKDQLNAELIITGGKSLWWDRDQPLPSPKELREMVPSGNESTMFAKIFIDHLANKEYGHVISFGDNDCPILGTKTVNDIAVLEFDEWNRGRFKDEISAMKLLSYGGTKVHEVHHFHTLSYGTPTGYARWANSLADKIHYSQDWAKYIVD